MSNFRRITFDGFTLDLSEELLWRGSERIHLRPKTFALLAYLTARSGRLVTKNELLSALWQDLNVGEEALKHCVAEIRKALSDDAEAPKFLETVHRRGYRFIPVTGPRRNRDSELSEGSREREREPASSGYRLVGRASELARLQHCLENANRGVRQTVFIEGEPGIGKTSLIDAFLDLAALQNPAQAKPGSAIDPWVGRGQCIKAHSVGEAYMPFFEALTGLCRQPGGKRFVTVLRRVAPLCLSQMPSLINSGQLRSLRRATLGAMRERMLREMAEALEALASKELLILILEDLHWSDCSSLDLISYWSQRRGPAKLLLIGTYRRAEAAAKDHPLKTLVQELKARQQCQEVPLAPLDQAAVEEYLLQRFPGNGFPAGTAEWIQQRTKGSPLLMVSIVDNMGARGLVMARGHGTRRENEEVKEESTGRAPD